MPGAVATSWLANHLAVYVTLSSQLLLLAFVFVASEMRDRMAWVTTEALAL